MALTTKRIIALPSQTDPQEGDYLAIDNAQGGTHKIPVGRIGVEVDDTLTEQGKAADAKAVGDALDEIRSQAEATDDAIDEIRSQIEVTGTASGAIATFADGSDMPMVACTASITPKQSGTGTPSPDNVRPISGWESVNVTACGVNVWDEEWEQGGLYNSTGLPNDSATSYFRTKNFIPIKPSTTYYFKTSGDSLWRFYYDANKNFLSYAGGISNAADNTVANACYMKLVNVSGNSYDSSSKPISINYPSTDHDYHAYTGTTTSVNLGRTVYGGTLDVVSGVLTVTWVAVEPPASWWGYDSGNSRWSAGLSPAPKPTGNNRSAEVVAEAYETNTSVQQGGIGCFRYSIGLYVYNNSSTTPPTGKFCYPLATPQTYTLTGQEISTLLGDNNVWADSGDVEVVYVRDLNIAINNLLNNSGTRSLGMMAMSAPTEATADEPTDEPAEDDMR